MGEGNTSGGGIHPGQPVIWPTGKKTASTQDAAVQSPSTTQTTGGVRSTSGNAQAQRTSQAQSSDATSAAATPGKTAATAAKTGAQNIARPVTIEDIKAHLVKIQVPDDEMTLNLASLMLKNGVELSRNNFVKLFSMLEGTDKSTSTQEAALMLLMKDLPLPAALKLLSRYFSENPQLAQQLMALAEEMGVLGSAMGAAKGAINPALAARIAALLSQFDELLKDIPGKGKFTGDGSVSREALLNDVRAFKALFEGIEAELPQTGKAGGEGAKGGQVLGPQLKTVINRLNSVLENLTSQAILSKASDKSEVNYQYYQIPNSMVNPPKNLEILLRRNGEGSQAIIDPDKTQIVMSMETQNLGKLSICLTVRDKNVGILFNTQNEEARSIIAKEFNELREKFSDQNYVTTSFQAKVNPAMCSIKPYLIPILGLDNLLKVDIEA